MSNGLVIIGNRDTALEGKANVAKIPYTYATYAELVTPFERTLIIKSGTAISFGLLPAAWHFLERWDAAVPFWRYGVLAADLGDDSDRKQTAAIIRDLRVLVHSVELLFVRNNEAGRDLVQFWQHEMASGGDKRLAFLRALYTVKPRLCVLPTSWLNAVEFENKQGIYQARRQPMRNTAPLVRVEVAPGRFVQVHKGDEQRAIAAYEGAKNGRAKL
jgi:hypothetical protein